MSTGDNGLSPFVSTKDLAADVVVTVESVPSTSGVSSTVLWICAVFINLANTVFMIGFGTSTKVENISATSIRCCSVISGVVSINSAIEGTSASGLNAGVSTMLTGVSSLVLVLVVWELSTSADEADSALMVVAVVATDFAILVCADEVVAGAVVGLIRESVNDTLADPKAFRIFSIESLLEVADWPAVENATCVAVAVADIEIREVDVRLVDGRLVVDGLLVDVRLVVVRLVEIRLRLDDGRLEDSPTEAVRALEVKDEMLLRLLTLTLLEVEILLVLVRLLLILEEDADELVGRLTVVCVALALADCEAICDA